MGTDLYGGRFLPVTLSPIVLIDPLGVPAETDDVLEVPGTIGDELPVVFDPKD